MCFRDSRDSIWRHSTALRAPSAPPQPQLSGWPSLPLWHENSDSLSALSPHTPGWTRHSSTANEVSFVVLPKLLRALGHIFRNLDLSLQGSAHTFLHKWQRAFIHRSWFWPIITIALWQFVSVGDGTHFHCRQTHRAAHPDAAGIGIIRCSNLADHVHRKALTTPFFVEQRRVRHCTSHQFRLADLRF